MTAPSEKKVTRRNALSLRTKIFLGQGFLCAVLIVVVGITFWIISGTITKHQLFTDKVKVSVGEFAAGVGKTVLTTTQSYQRVIETQLDGSMNLINSQEKLYQLIDDTRTLLHKMQNKITTFVINNDPYEDIENDINTLRKMISNFIEYAEIHLIDKKMIENTEKALTVYTDMFRQISNKDKENETVTFEQIAIESIPLGQLLEKRVKVIVDKLKDIHKDELHKSVNDALQELKKIDANTENIISSLELKQKSIRNIIDSILLEFSLLTTSLNESRSGISIICVIAIALSLGFTMMLVRNVNTIVLKLMSFSDRIAKGDFDVEDLELTSRDELAELAQNMNEMKNKLHSSFDQLTIARKRDENVVDRLKQAMEVIRKIGQGDLSHQLQIDANDTVGELAGTMNSIVNELQKMIVRIQESAYRLSSASFNLAAENKELAERTNSQTTTLEQTVNSLEEIDAIVNRNAIDATNTYEISLQTKEVAAAVRSNLMRAIGETVSTSEAILEKLQSTNKNVVHAMSEIFTRSQKVSGIITLINDIAFQTNLLSLNAAVEAARAGEQGKGFAVVAAEIRNLAWRSSKASKEIDKLIGSSLEQIEKGTRLVDSSDKTMTEMREILENILAELKRQSDTDLDKIHTSVTEVSELVNNIKNASVNQAAGINEVNFAIAELEKIAQGNSLQVEKTTASSLSLAEEAENMSLIVEKFKLSSDMQLRVRQQVTNNAGNQGRMPVVLRKGSS